MRRRAAQADPAKQDEFMVRMANYTKEQLVFCDESAINNKANQRKWGWGPLGHRVPVSTPFIRNPHRWSILPAISTEGYIAIEVLEGGYDTVTFNRFVASFLPLMNAYNAEDPAPLSVLVMDNCSIHKSEDLQVLCNEYGVRLEFLPPYSPQFNPIEKTFSVLKAYIRKRDEECLVAFQENRFEHFLVDCAGAAITSEIAENEFKACGY